MYCNECDNYHNIDEPYFNPTMNANSSACKDKRKHSAASVV